ncbi:leucine-rich repeat receptor serine/threonine-protein kinase [Salix suchowensis]|nr:leucine-rich repeat receptor serine/threonine-protein kinase [Salix suchowensis]
MSFSRLLFASLIAFGLAAYAVGAAVLPDDEVKALRDIAKTLGKTGWNFSANPCGGQWGWLIQVQWKGVKMPYPATAPSQMAPSAMSPACKLSLSLSLSLSPSPVDHI